MSDKIDELFATSLKDLKTDIRQLDGKFDTMHEILIRNTLVLEQHEQRSTASENRIEVLEDKSLANEIKDSQLKGFYIYGAAIMAALGSLASLFHYVILPFLKK